MRTKFDSFLKNGLTDYEAEYLNDFKYVLMLCKNGVISAYFANGSYAAFIEYPENNKDYATPEMVLKDEMNLTNCESGIIYENVDGKGIFQPIAFIDNTRIQTTGNEKLR